MTLRAGTRTVAVAALVALTAGPARANPESDKLRAKASHDIYNLDRDEAIDGFRRAIAADPQDAAAYRGLASSLWVSIRSEEHTSELQSLRHLVCRLLLEKKKRNKECNIYQKNTSNQSTRADKGDNARK